MMKSIKRNKVTYPVENDQGIPKNIFENMQNKNHNSLFNNWNMYLSRIVLIRQIIQFFSLYYKTFGPEFYGLY